MSYRWWKVGDVERWETEVPLVLDRFSGQLLQQMADFNVFGHFVRHPEVVTNIQGILVYQPSSLAEWLDFPSRPTPHQVKTLESVRHKGVNTSL